MRPTERGSAATLAVFLATFAIYAALVPWVTRVWQRTGDEPHYLLAAHSLVVDHDFDLRNNYDRGDFLAFWTGEALDRHVVAGASGAQVLSHNVGLPLLIAPAYALGGLSGVGYFMALLGALLAAQVFALACELSGDARAALLAWILAAFTPPVLWYVFLISPELPGALATIVALRALVHGERGAARRGELAACALALAALPFLSSRYLIVVAAFGLGAAWLAWRGERRWLPVIALAALGLAAYLGVNAALYGSFSPAASYQGETAIGVDADSLFTRTLRGLLGWPLDVQRGLLWWSPAYVLALAGLLRLARGGRAATAALAAAPGVLMLGATAVWGGFWTPWEMGPRYLVIGLPALGAASACAWSQILPQTGRRLFEPGGARRLAAGALGAASLALGLYAGALTVHQPHIAYASALPAELEARLGVPLTAWLPAMGGYAALLPTRASGGGGALVRGVPGAGRDGAALTLGAERPELLAQWPPVAALPFGWYRLTWLVRADAPGAPGRLATLQLVAPYGVAAIERAVDASEVPPDGAFHAVTVDFHQDAFDAWARPFDATIFSSGRAALWSGEVRIDPDEFHALVLPLVWALVVALIVLALAWAPLQGRQTSWSVNAAGARYCWLLPALVALAGIALVAWSLVPHPVVYGPAHLTAATGARVADAAATWGTVQRAAGDRAEALGATPREFYAPGMYVLRARVRVSAPDAQAPVLRVRVAAQQQAVAGGPLDVRAADMPADGQFHEVALPFDNPRWQALSFVVDYLGQGRGELDTLTVAGR
jgi:hypothetical protein